jgi:penicillin amidase
MPPRARLGAALLVAYLLGRARRRRAVALGERLKAIPARDAPVRAPLTIHWSEHQIPFLDAAHDEDAAVGLGLVHTHLRWAQMEMMRRAAHGRLAEVLGSVAVELDHALRALDLTRAVPRIEAALPASTRRWIEGFVAGINHYVAHAPEPPYELRMLGMARQSWTPRDVLCVGRLAAADSNWLLWTKLLRLRRRADWPDIWNVLIREGTAPVPAADEPAPADPLGSVLGHTGRFGSNAVAVGPARSASGAAWLAGDSHLSLVLPNLWLVAGWRSPSYHVVGLMIPGIPAIAIGRNPWIAWGGTNLHAASSDLFDVETDTAWKPARALRIPVRWSRAARRSVRESRAGPVISDAPMLGSPTPLGFRWVGHAPSDELSALLALNRARDGAAVRAALDGFAVPGQTFVYADRAGHIGSVIAAWLPRRVGPPDDIVLRSSRLADWNALVTARDLPHRQDPAAGFIVSANDPPGPAVVPIGWFFSPADRVARLTQLLLATSAVDFEALRTLHLDVQLLAAEAFKDVLVRWLKRGAPSPERTALAALLAGWDGAYRHESTGALAYELLVYHIAAALPPERALLADAVWHGRALLRGDVADLIEEATVTLDRAIRRTTAGLRRFGTWGEMHRLQLAHPFAALPIVGRGFRFADRPADGTSDTLLKTAHRPTARCHAASYGSTARYIFDMSDPDGNYVALLGGQDGWIGSSTFLDQLPLWETGSCAQIPLQLGTIERQSSHRTVLTPP